jgi:ribonuclease D
VSNAINLQPIWVDTTPIFESMQAALLKEPVIGVDTESNSLHAYQEQVCLIQFSTPQQDFLLDPLAGLDLKPLGQLFSSNEIEKIFHAAEYDIICLRRDFKFDFKNIFDTMQAARILGREKLSLGDQVESEFGIQLDKHNQKANWAVRPLSPPMQSYACLDTHFLIPLHINLKKELYEHRLQDLAEEDFNRLCQSSASENHKPLYTQVGGYQDLDRRQLAVLNELCLFRDRLAKRNNLPLFKILGNSALLEIAQHCPKSEQDLKKVKVLPIRLFERHKEGLLAAVHDGMKAKPIDLPFHPRPDGRTLARWDRLKAWRKKKAEEMKVLSDIILPKDILEEIAEQNPQSSTALQKIMESVPWRYEKFGSEIIHSIKEKK